MKAYFPLAIGASIPSKVIKSLMLQTIDIDIIPCCTTGIIGHNTRIAGIDQTEKVKCEMMSRNLALDMIKASNDEFAIMQDNDVVHLFDSNYFAAMVYMQNNPDIGILSLPWKDYIVYDHIRMQALILRTQALKSFIFRLDERRHLCATMKDDMEQLGWQCCFMPSDKKLIYELV